MNFWNLAILSLTLLAPVALVLFLSSRSKVAPGAEVRTAAALFGLMMLAAVVGVARYDQPVKMEFLWPLTLEQSGYFEFSLQVFWTRFVWLFFVAALPLGYVSFDSSVPAGGVRRSASLLFFIGASFFASLAFLCENVLLSLMFLEISLFLLHAFGMQGGNELEAMEKASYFKRSCFVFLALWALLAIAASRQLSSPSVVLLGAVFYLLSTTMSKHNPSRWSQLPIFLIQLGLALFLMERVMPEDASGELWAPLAALFAVGCVGFATVSLLTLGLLGSSFWMVLSFAAYLLFLRFSSSRPADSFWGAYEAVGLGAAYAISLMFRFGMRLDVFWKKALAYVLLAVFLGVISGTVPGVEAGAFRFESEFSIVRFTLLGLLTFFISVISSKALTVSLGAEPEAGSGGGALLPVLAPSFLLFAIQAGLLFKWSEMNFEDLGAGGLMGMLYDPRVFVSGTAVAAGILAGGLFGTNSRFTGWIKKYDLRMELLFPRVDPAIVKHGLHIIRLPARGIEWLTSRISGAGGAAAGAVDTADRGFFGERFFLAFADYSSSLSLFVRYFHSGQTRAYLFLGILVTLLSSLIFLVEGR